MTQASKRNYQPKTYKDMKKYNTPTCDIAIVAPEAVIMAASEEIEIPIIIDMSETIDDESEILTNPQLWDEEDEEGWR